MAVITKFEPMQTASGSLQKTQVTGYFKVFGPNGHRILQVDTRGSAGREHPGKVSQTIQLTETSAKALWSLLGQEFGFKA